ncbi:hypothetical protein [Nitrosospira sp. Nsp1]|uniref:hypothetical protein n=1 Tax=Nitrosospira sp. Nsp1 TaxID=136547 RepID=UPI00088FA5EF|nr:hypothetical protein [Nitrosospira sp. Nsp1]SCX40486.1 hypothetical protein SAMN05720354_103117 [Nitrosospira sp. Nsp1]
MKMIAVLAVVVLAGCTTAPFRVFLGEYKKDGATEQLVSEDRDACSKEAWEVFNNTAARGQVASYFMQRHMYECMKKRGYESTDVHPDAYKQTL